MAEEQKKCFIIMPISTPDTMIDKYRDGPEHFSHVLECLFRPSIEKAGYELISPIAEGADNIPAEIISNLETADLVLCDMSCLNPNVFFEFGIRTALNKPVCVVRDELTEKVPFDTSTINHKEYKSGLDPWNIDDEIDMLSKHLNASAMSSKGGNTLWKYFGLKSKAIPFKSEGGTEAKLDYISMQLDSLKENIRLSGASKTYVNPPSLNELVRIDAIKYIMNELNSLPALEQPELFGTEEENGIIYVIFVGSLSNKIKARLQVKLHKVYNVSVHFKKVPPEYFKN